MVTPIERQILENQVAMMMSLRQGYAVDGFDRIIENTLALLSQPDAREAAYMANFINAQERYYLNRFLKTASHSSVILDEELAVRGLHIAPLPSEETVRRVASGLANHYNSGLLIGMVGNRTQGDLAPDEDFLDAARRLAGLINAPGVTWKPIEEMPKTGKWFLGFNPNSDMAWAPYEFISWSEDSSGRGYYCQDDTSEETECTMFCDFPDPPSDKARLVSEITGEQS